MNGGTPPLIVQQIPWQNVKDVIKYYKMWKISLRNTNLSAVFMQIYAQIPEKEGFFHKTKGMDSKMYECITPIQLSLLGCSVVEHPRLWDGAPAWEVGDPEFESVGRCHLYTGPWKSGAFCRKSTNHVFKKYTLTSRSAEIHALTGSHEVVVIPITSSIREFFTLHRPNIVVISPKRATTGSRVQGLGAGINIWKIDLWYDSVY